MGIYVEGNDGKTKVHLPTSFFVEVIRSMGWGVTVPEGYDPDFWDGDDWSYVVPAGVNWQEEIGLQLGRTIDALSKLEKLTNERFSAAVGMESRYRQNCVSEFFHDLRVAGFDFGKDWEEQTQEFHTKLAAIIDQLVDHLVDVHLNPDPNTRKEFTHFIAPPVLPANPDVSF